MLRLFPVRAVDLNPARRPIAIPLHGVRSAVDTSAGLPRIRPERRTIDGAAFALAADSGLGGGCRAGIGHARRRAGHSWLGRYAGPDLRAARLRRPAARRRRA